MTVLKLILYPHSLEASYWESAQNKIFKEMWITNFECPQAVQFMMQSLSYNYKAF